MAEIRPVEPVIRICAIITRHDALRCAAREYLQRQWGDVIEESPLIDFEAGGFYRSTMGEGLKKQMVGFEPYCDPANLADWKHQTNQWETALMAGREFLEPRPLNLDPGYMSQAKLVLATTKDRDHRIYLRDGMFAEVTLTYVGKKWVHHRWTYPSYRSDALSEFAENCRNRLRVHLRRTRQFRTV